MMLAASQILVQHIKKCIPGIRNRIAAAILDAHTQLDSYGPAYDAKDAEKVWLLQVLAGIAIKLIYHARMPCPRISL